MPLSSLNIVVLAVVALALAGCATTAPPPPAAPTEPPALQTRDPNEAALAAVRAAVVAKNPAEAVRLAAQAVALAPNRADLMWLHLRVCMTAAKCDPEPLAARLRKAAPDNGVVWLSALARAQAERDARTEEQVLAAMSAAPHVNVYWTTLVSKLAPTLAASVSATANGQAPTPLTRSLNDVSVWLSRLMLPAFSPLNAACNAAQVRQPLRRASCERLAAALQASDSYAAEGVGLGIAQRLAPQGSEPAQRIEERIATLAYQNRAASAVMTGQLEREKFSAELVELMQKLPREQDVSQAILRWAGQPLTP